MITSLKTLSTVILLQYPDVQQGFLSLPGHCHGLAPLPSAPWHWVLGITPTLLPSQQRGHCYFQLHNPDLKTHLGDLCFKNSPSTECLCPGTLQHRPEERIQIPQCHLVGNRPEKRRGKENEIKKYIVQWDGYRITLIHGTRQHSRSHKCVFRAWEFSKSAGRRILILGKRSWGWGGGGWWWCVALSPLPFPIDEVSPFGELMPSHSRPLTATQKPVSHSLKLMSHPPNFKMSGTGEMTTKKDRKKAFVGIWKGRWRFYFKPVSTHPPSIHTSHNQSHHAMRDLHSVHEQNMHNRDTVHAPGTMELDCRESIRGEKNWKGLQF